MKSFQVIGKNEVQLNRFYSAFYRKLVDPQIGVANKRAIFLNLLYRVLRNDHSVIRLQAYMKRIFQVVLYYPANMACAMLFVVSQVLKLRKDAKQILARFEPEVKIETETIDEENEESDSDEENERSDKEIKRREEDRNIVLSNVTIGTSAKFISKNEEVIEIKEEPKIKEEFNTDKEYDPFCRNPLGSGANNTFFYELFALSNHFHPSVALFAKNIMEGKHYKISLVQS